MMSTMDSLHRIAVAISAIVIGGQGLLTAEAHSSSNLKTGQKISCPPDQELDPYVVWKDVRTREEAKKFLLAQYQAIGDVEEFSQWLHCQDFVVVLGDNKSADEKIIGASFMTASADRETLWPIKFLFGLGKVQSQFFDIRFKNGKIETLEIHSMWK